ncbi:MAG: ubiquitin-like small modifier protein 1 [Candidatus Heimdallarchaeota archaeon]
MKIQIKFFAALREIVGKKAEFVELDGGGRVQDVIRHLIETYGTPLEQHLFDKQGKLTTSYQLLINGINISTLEGLETPLKEGDTLAILPPVGGGA